MQNQPSGLKWLFLDLNSYFASVEQQENPALQGKPVAVVPMDTPYTCAIAASYEAKAYGIKTGTMIADAKRMCPALRCVVARHDKYVEYHHRILEEVIKHIPINKVWSIDELSSRLPLRLQDEHEATLCVKRLKDGLRDNIGAHIKCSIGIAPNSFLAKVATNMQKPDGFVVLRPQDLPGRLLELRLIDLPGINVNMQKRLYNAGIHTLEAFWNISPKHARKIWGSVGGEKFWYNLHGFEIPDTVTHTSTIGHSRVLDPVLRSPVQARLVTRQLTTKATARLRRQNFYATRLALSVRGIDRPRWAAETRTPPSQDNFTFLGALDNLWDAMSADMAPRQIKKVSISLYGLCRNEDITPDLFSCASTDEQNTQKHNDAITTAMDALNRRFGAQTIQLGPAPKTDLKYAETKIAFSRIPDREEFQE